MANTHIVTFIQHLSDTESKLAAEYLSRYQGIFNDKDGNESKELQLFKYITSRKSENITDDEIMDNIEVKDLSHLKTHLYNKVLESLTFDRYIKNSSIFNEYDSIALSLKKKVLIFKTNLRTINHGKTEALKELLNEIIEVAIEYELYDTLVEALIAKKYFFSLRIGQTEFDHINAAIDFYSACGRAVYFATDCYYKIIINNELIKSLNTNEVEKHIKSSIKKIEMDLKATKSVQVNYYLHVLQFAYSERQKKYKQAIKQCESLLDLLKKNKVIYRKERIGNALLNLSEFKTRVCDYSSAAQDAKKAKEHYTEDSFDYNVATSQEFHAYFYGKKYLEAEIAANKLQQHFSSDIGEFRKSKFIYYGAYIRFAVGKFKEALILLNESLEIEKDKSRWNVALRILQIQLFIELSKVDEAANHLESLRKYIERTSKNEEIRERDDMIVRFLREIEKSGFQYDPSNKSAAKLLEELSDNKGAFAWEHYSPELIPFHDWILKKS